MSNMYPFVDKTKNYIVGECPHKCIYCYVKKSPYKQVVERYSGELRLIESTFKKPLGSGKFYFIGSCIDMWAWEIPDEWIERILEHNRKYPSNTYLYQSKNPQRFRHFYGKFPDNTILGTTLESSNEYPSISEAPPILERYGEICFISKEDGGRTMVTIEPILMFDLKEFVTMIKDIEPEWVNIGADSKGYNLPEPSQEEIKQLVAELHKFTKVILKDNLKRIYNGS